MVRHDHGGHPEARGQDQGRIGGAAKDRRGPRNEAHLNKTRFSRTYNFRFTVPVFCEFPDFRRFMNLILKKKKKLFDEVYLFFKEKLVSYPSLKSMIDEDLILLSV